MTEPPDNLPRHVAIIMDGNGRWAGQRNLPRTEGHRAGAEAARDVAQCCVDWGIPVLTLYAFSTENWNRPRREVSYLMSELRRFLRKHRDDFVENDIRLRPIGELERLPEAVRGELEATVEATGGCGTLDLVLALSYGSRQEITRAVRTIAHEVRDGRLEPEQIDQETVQRHLYTADLPPLDLLIRTGGEMRVSNFLLWQLHYAELYLTPTYWPDFGKAEFADALRAYADRERRFGTVKQGEGKPEGADAEAAQAGR